MKAERSELLFKNLVVWKQEVEFLPPEEEDASVPEKMREELQELPIEADIGNQEEEGSNEFQVNVSFDIRPSQGERGYRIHLSMAGIFELDPEGLSEDRYKNLRYFSALNLMISNAREKIRQSTKELPLGAYLLPPLDLQDLIKKKKEEEKKKEE